MIRLAGLDKSVHQSGGPPRPILRDVNLTVPEGCLYGLIGPGASGKSVLLKMIAGLMKPDRGSVRIGDDAVTDASELALQEIRKRIGMLFQNNALFDHLTVFDNVAFPLRRLYAPPEDEVRARVAERLACVSLPGFEERMPANLSGGQKKRVGVARATATRAPIVLYDEPAAGLDPGHVAEDLRSAARRAARHRRDGGHGLERSRSPAHGHRPRRHDVPRGAHLRRHDRRGARLRRSPREAVRPRADGGAAVTSRAGVAAGPAALDGVAAAPR